MSKAATGIRRIQLACSGADFMRLPNTTITTVVEGEGAYITNSSSAAAAATVSRRYITTFGDIITGIEPNVEVSEIGTTSETKNSRKGSDHLKRAVFPLAAI